MKTRILVETDGHGVSRFYPQYNAWIFWNYFKEFNTGYEWKFKVVRNTLEDAKYYIDKMLKIEDDVTKRFTITKEIIKYP